MILTGITGAPCILLAQVFQPAMSQAPIRLSPALHPLVTAHHVFAGKCLPMALISAWCVKFWTG